MAKISFSILILNDGSTRFETSISVAKETYKIIAVKYLTIHCFFFFLIDYFGILVSYIFRDRTYKRDVMLISESMVISFLKNIHIYLQLTRNSTNEKSFVVLNIFQ